ncbi:MAG: hypothetical protein ACREQX_18815 [Candidatus Binataceae bacterium]
MLPSGIVRNRGVLYCRELFTPGVGTDLAHAPEVQSWLSTSASSGGIPSGTTITMENWQQYKQYMPLGMQVLFEGRYFWKMPTDIQMPVGPTVMHDLPPWVASATEKYSGQVRVVHLPNGHMDVQNLGTMFQLTAMV